MARNKRDIGERKMFRTKEVATMKKEETAVRRKGYKIKVKQYSKTEQSSDPREAREHKVKTEDETKTRL